MRPDIEGIQEVLGVFSDADIMMKVLSMGDEEFEIMREVLLNEMRAVYSRPEEQVKMIDVLRMENLTVEDMREIESVFLQQIDETLVGTVSASKVSFFKEMIGIVMNSIAETEGVYKRTIRVPFEKITDEPMIESLGSSGLKVVLKEEISIAPGERIIIPLGYKVALPAGYQLEVWDTLKGVGHNPIYIEKDMFDQTYRDELYVRVYNQDFGTLFTMSGEGKPLHVGIDREPLYVLKEGTHIANLLLREVPTPVLFEVDKISEWDKGVK